MKMQKKINGEIMVREFPSRNLAMLKSKGWKLVPKPKPKKETK